MSIERELLKKILATRWLDHELSCEVEAILAQPEPTVEPVAWMWTNEELGGVYFSDIENPNWIPLYIAPKREPIDGKEISKGFQADYEAIDAYSYWAGVAFAEKYHGIRNNEQQN